ncbi:MAG: hydrolase [Legionella sp.]|nr:MAG: hydrolase [Legionella sp.]
MSIQESYQLIAEMTKLKLVFRNTITHADRKESTAEHSWSASMIIVILTSELRKEFPEFDELKTIKLVLIHDIVEIYAGDVIAFDVEARKNKEQAEQDALLKLMGIYPVFGEELHNLWYEFEKKESIEAKIAKAADAICPIFQRLQTKQSYVPYHISIPILDNTKWPQLAFSQTFQTLYQTLKNDLLEAGLIEEM